MTKNALAGLAGLIALCGSGAAVAATAFLPGLYETRVTYPGQDTPPEIKRECVTPAEAREETLERHLADALRDGACRFTQRRIGNGTFAIAGTCTNQGMRSTVKQTGTYTPTSMTMDMAMSLTAAPGVPPVALDMRISARRVAATCPPGTDRD